MTNKDKSGDQDKSYIVEDESDHELTEEDKQKLKQKKESSEGFDGRQDVFIDRRDPNRDGDYKGPERRKSPDRRND